MHSSVADPDPQMRGVGGGHPDPEIRGGGEGGAGLQKNYFRPLGPQFDTKITGGRPPVPPLDPPLLLQ